MWHELAFARWGREDWTRAVKTLFLGPLFFPSTLSPGKETLGTRVGKKLDYNAVTVETLVSCISEAIDIFSAEFVLIIMIIISFVCPRQYL